MKVKNFCIHIGAAVVVIVVASLVFIFATTHVQAQVDRAVHDEVVSGLEDQISLLKWVGSSVIVSLCAAVTTLFWLLVKQWRVIVGEVRHAGDTRTSMNKLADAIDRLEKKIEQCPVSREWEEIRDRLGK